MVNFSASWGICSLKEGSKGWCSGESPRLPPMWPGFKFQHWCHMGVEFVVGSLVCFERFFSGYSGFPLSSKTNIWWTKFQFDQESGRRRTTMWTCYLWIIIYIIYRRNHKLTLEMTAFVTGNQVPVRRTERIHFDC